MPLKHSSYTSGNYVILVTIKDSFSQCLGEWVRQVINRRYLLNHYITSINYIKNQVVLPPNVFTFLVVSWFFWLCHGLTVVTKQYHGLYNQRHDPKSNKELSKPNNFLCCFRNYNVFSFHSEIKNTRLVHTFLTNNRTIKSKTKTGGRPIRILIRLGV